MDDTSSMCQAKIEHRTGSRDAHSCSDYMNEGVSTHGPFSLHVFKTKKQVTMYTKGSTFRTDHQESNSPPGGGGAG